jgi:hypothetical protein
MRMWARWKLGRALAEVERQQVIGPGRGNVRRDGTVRAQLGLLVIRRNHKTAVKADERHA